MTAGAPWDRFLLSTETSLGKQLSGSKAKRQDCSEAEQEQQNLCPVCAQHVSIMCSVCTQHMPSACPVCAQWEEMDRSGLRLGDGNHRQVYIHKGPLHTETRGSHRCHQQKNAGTPTSHLRSRSAQSWSGAQVSHKEAANILLRHFTFL